MAGEVGVGLIRAMSLVLSGPGRSLRGSESSRCSVAATGRLVTHATIASRASSSSGTTRLRPRLA